MLAALEKNYNRPTSGIGIAGAAGESSKYLGVSLSAERIDVSALFKASGSGDKRLLYLNWKAVIW